MIDKILLAPYYGILKLRHWMYDKGVRKSVSAPVPTICIGNVTVGGTGKTPHTEMLVRMLSEHPAWRGKHIAVLSRGYKRKSKGFLEVLADGDAAMYGDEPLQIKKKFPTVTVAVDRSRVEGCRILTDPQDGRTTGKADLIILDDAFQHRALNPTVSIVLVDYNRPVYSDSLMPIGHLRDLPERIHKADIVIVTKCPLYIEAGEKNRWAETLKISGFDAATGSGTAKGGKVQHLFFTTIGYDALEPVWPEGDPRYIHSKRAILFSGIANDTPLLKYLSDSYQVVKHLAFGDHHEFTAGDIKAIQKAAREYPTAVIITTEKDSQRLRGIRNVHEELKSRTFQAPIRPLFLGLDGSIVNGVENGGDEFFLQALLRPLSYDSGQDGIPSGGL